LFVGNYIFYLVMCKVWIKTNLPAYVFVAVFILITFCDIFSETLMLYFSHDF